MSKTQFVSQIDKIARGLLASFSAQEPLLDQFDSLQIITLVSEVEKALGVQIPAIELSRENLESIEKLADLVGRYHNEK